MTTKRDADPEGYDFRFARFMAIKASAWEIRKVIDGRNGVCWMNSKKSSMAKAYAGRATHLRREVTISDATVDELIAKFGTRKVKPKDASRE